MPTSLSGESKVLFGSKSHPWSPEDWTATDDRVRGGSSVSHLTCSPSRHSATFHGTLDIRTLGGAGFASQRTVDSLKWDLSGYDSLVLCLCPPPSREEQEADASSAGKRYTVVLKDTDSLPKRPDGREQSTVSWEFDFEIDGQGRAADGKDVVVMPFAQFKATYRGKPKEDAEPLDLSRITRVSFMMRSFFGEQEGDFSLGLKSLSAAKNKSCQPGQAESVYTNEKHSLDKPLPEQKGTEKQEQEQRSWLSWLGSCFR